MRRSFIIIAYLCVHHRFFPAELKLINDCNEDFCMVNLHLFGTDSLSYPSGWSSCLLQTYLAWLAVLSYCYVQFFAITEACCTRNATALVLYQQHYWNLTEKFCQITILFPWRKIRCIHQSADIFVKPFF